MKNLSIFNMLHVFILSIYFSPSVLFSDSGIISVNFTCPRNYGGRGNLVTIQEFAEQPIGYEGYAVKGKYWVDCTAPVSGGFKSGSIIPINYIDEQGRRDPYRQIKSYLFWGGGWGVYANGGHSVDNANMQMLHSYLDDANSKTGQRAGFKLKTLPFSRYTVLIYFNRHTSGEIPAYKINGICYKGTAEGTVLAAENETWGNPSHASTLSQELNTLIVKDLAAPNLVVEASDQADGRGCISGFQIRGELPQTTAANCSANISGDASWTAKTGMAQFNGTWSDHSQSTLTLTNNLTSPVTFVWDQDIQASSLTLVGTGDTSFSCSPDKQANLSLYDLSRAGKTSFDYGTGTADIDAGLDTRFSEKGSGDLTIKEGKKATITLDEPATRLWDGPVKNNGIIGKAGSATWNAKPGSWGNGGLSLAEGRVIFNNSGQNYTLNRPLIVEEGACFTTFSDYKYLFSLTDELSGKGILRISIPNVSSQTDGWRPSSIYGDTANFTGTLEIEGTQGETETSCYRVMTILNPKGETFGKVRFVGVTFVENSLSVDNPGSVPTGSKLEIGKSLTLKGLDGLGGTLYPSRPSTVLTLDNDAECTFNGQIQGELGLKKSNTGKLTLGGNSSYSAGTSIESGILAVTATHSLGTGPVTLAGGTLDLGTIRPANLLKTEGLTGGTIKITLTEQEFSSTSIIKILDTVFSPSEASPITIEAQTLKGEPIDSSHFFFTDGYTLVFKPNASATARTDRLDLFARVQGDNTWQELQWKHYDGTPYSGPWGENVANVRLLTENGRITTIPSLSIGRLTVIGDGSLSISPAAQQELLIGLADLSSHRGYANFEGNVICTDVISGKETKLALPGTGTLTIPSGSGVICDGFIWPANKLVHYGVMTVQGGTEQNPLEINTLFPDTHGILAITNGTAVLKGNEANRGLGYLPKTKVKINNGGTLLFDSGDVSGWNIVDNPIEINKGGKLRIMVRDSLRRGLILNGGKVVISGSRPKNNRDLDFYKNLKIKVTQDSEIIGVKENNGKIPGEIAENVIVWIREGTTTFDVDSGATLINAITYRPWYTPGFEKIGAGKMVQNGMPPSTTGEQYPLDFKQTSIVKEGTYELNCEHQNYAGEYQIKTGAKLTGTGSISGSAPVRINAGGGGNAKLCGSLTINTLKFEGSAGETPIFVGDEEDRADVHVTNNLSIAGNEVNITLQNGGLTVAENCNATGFHAAKLVIGSDGRLGVAAGGTLLLDTPPVLHENATFRIGSDWTGSTPTYGTLEIGAPIDLLGSAFEINIEAGVLPHWFKMPLLTAPSITGVERISKTKLPPKRTWKYSVEQGKNNKEILYVEAIPGSLLILN